MPEKNGASRVQIDIGFFAPNHTVCAKFGLARNADGRDILYLTGILRMPGKSSPFREVDDAVRHRFLESVGKKQCD